MRRRACPPSAAEPAQVVRVARVGADGDGIAEAADGSLRYIPYSLPGELVRAMPGAVRGDGRAATAEAVLEPSAARAAPPCPHFGACGGCAVQHWRDAEYIAWKTELLAAALRRAGYAEAPVAPAVRTPPGARRRMDLALRRTPAGIVVGLHRARSVEIVDLHECPVLHPALAALIAPLRRLLAGLPALRREGSVIANLLDAGPDLLLRLDGEPGIAERTALLAFARTHGLPRVSWAGRDSVAEPVCVLRPATTRIGSALVAPPPGAFLQASAEGEAAIVAAVLAGLPDRLPARARIADLYAGCGTLSFALAALARVAAFEGDAAAVGCLRAAARETGRIEATQRDLARQPLSAAELARFAAVVLDPPHAGAPEQVAGIARSAVRRVVYVSCNPATLARDARTLRDAGFSLLRATPVDQFLWSARLESVAVFAR